MEFTNDFFKKEIREGFEVPEMMKRAWAAQMEVLQVVADVCARNGLQYFADFGTLLGAVRHQGFVPWDDDIDICLKREEFNRLLRILPQELPRGFVLAGMWAESKSLRMEPIMHLRVIADEMAWDFNEYMKYFHGFPYQRVGIDIFQLDYIPRDEELENLQRDISRLGMLLLKEWDALADQELERRLNAFENLCNTKIERTPDSKNCLRKLIDAIQSLYQKEEADFMTNYIEGLRQGNYKLKKEWYNEVVMLPFENMQIPAPAKYHEVLNTLYGDYRIPIRGTADHEYPFYAGMEEELEKTIKATGFTGSVEEFCQAVSSGKVRVKTR